jgi:hypothetical protein
LLSHTKHAISTQISLELKEILMRGSSATEERSSREESEIRGSCGIGDDPLQATEGGWQRGSSYDIAERKSDGFAGYACGPEGSRTARL